MMGILRFAGQRLHIGEFIRRAGSLTLFLVLCLAYQVIRIGITPRMLLRTLSIYFLLYAGFLYGKRFGGALEETFFRTAVFLGLAGILGLAWWAAGICPLGFASERAARFFLSAPERMVSIFTHPILAACYMLLLITIAWFSWPRQGERLWTALRMILLLAGLAGLYATFTRSAWLVLLLVTVIWIISNRKSVKAGIKNISRNAWIAVGAILAAALAIAWFSGMITAAYNRLFGVSITSDRSYTLRFDALVLILTALPARGIGRFLFGTGIERGKKILNVDWFQEKYGKKLIDNTYLSALADHGIFIAVLMAAELLRVLWVCLKEPEKSSIPSYRTLCCLLLPQLLMITVFDVQGWCSLLFVVCTLTGMEMALRPDSSLIRISRPGKMHKSRKA